MGSSLTISSSTTGVTGTSITAGVIESASTSGGSKGCSYE